MNDGLIGEECLFIPNTDLWAAAFTWWQQKRPKDMDIADYLEKPTAGVKKGADVILAEAVGRGLRSGCMSPDDYEATIIEDLNAAQAILDEISELVEDDGQPASDVAAAVRAVLARRQ